MKSKGILWSVIVAAGLMSASAEAIVVNPNPAADTQFPHVLVIGQMNNGTTRVTGGSCVIIAHDTVLTAGHVSSQNNTTNPNFVIYNGVDKFCTSQVLCPDWDGNGYPDVDIKLLKFPPNTFTSWSPIGIGSFTGREVTLVGQGAAGIFRANQTGFDVWNGTHNTRRIGKNVIEGYTYESYFAQPSYLWSAPYFELDRPNGSPGNYPYSAVPNEATYGPLDSGGGMYLAVGSTQYLIGNHNFVWDGNGNYSNSFNQLLDYGDGGAAVDMNDTRVKQFLTANGIPQTTLRTLSGSISSLGISASAWNGNQIAIKIYAAGTSNLLETLTASLGSTGNFSAVFASTGTVDIMFSVSGSLVKGIYNRPVGTGISGLSVPLIMGDGDGDNAVTASDYGAWSVANGSFQGEPTFSMSVDFDRDGAITPSDYGIWQLNNGLLGDEPAGS